MVSRTIPMVLSIILLMACSHTNDIIPPSEIARIETEVATVYKNFEKGLRQGKLDEISKLYSQDARFYWVENGVVAYPDGASARRALQEFYPSLQQMEFNTIEKKITVLNASLAMIFVSYHQEMTFQNNYTLAINGAMTILMEKTDEHWQFLIGHSSGKNENQNSYDE